MIKCAECGYENMDGLDYCDGCGAKLNAAAPAPAESSPATEVVQAAVAGTAPEGAAAAMSPEPSEGAEGNAAKAPTGEMTAPAPAATPSAAPAPAAPFKAKLSITRGTA